jgi:LysM repeat protein
MSKKEKSQVGASGSSVESLKRDIKAIVIKETEEDIVFDAGFSDLNSFKDEVKKEAEKGDVSKFVIAVIIFLLIGGAAAAATWYYARPEKTVPSTEDKIKTPPVVTPETTTPAPAPTPVPAPTSQTYTVVEGDTMSGIANKYNLTSQELAIFNAITDVNSLHIGQVLKIPTK